MHHIVTTADARFFPFALSLVQTMRCVPQVRLFVYDLGLTEAQRNTLAELHVTVEHIAIPDDSFAINSAQNIRAVHKLNCIEHFLHTYKEGMILLDADILVLEPCALDALGPGLDEVVVTYRCRRENKPHILNNGKINSGVMAFGRNLPAVFFDTWRSMCRDPEHTDQSALSAYMDENGVNWRVLNASQSCVNVRVRVLDGEIYNDTSCRVGKLFHFKSAGRRASKLFWYRCFVSLLRMAPSFVRCVVRLNRRYAFFVWKPKN